MEVVKVDLIDSIPEAEQNVSFSQNSSNSNLAAELQRSEEHTSELQSQR